MYRLILLCFFVGSSCLAQTPNILPPLGFHFFIADFDISPDSKHIATVSIDNNFVIWDIESGHALTSQPAHGSSLSAIRYFPDGSKFVTASVDSTLKIWNATSFKLENIIKTGMKNSSLCIDKKGEYIMVGGENGEIKLYNGSDLSLFKIFKEHDANVTSAEFISNSDIILSSDITGRFKIIATKAGAVGADITLEAPITSIVVDDLNSACAIHTTQGRAEILLIPSFEAWNAIKTPTKSYPRLGNATYTSQIAFSPDSKYFAYTDENHSLFIANAVTKQANSFKTPHEAFISKIKYSKNGRYIVSAGHGYKICVTDLNNYDEENSKHIPYRILKYNQNHDAPNRIEFTKNHSLVAEGHNIYNWSLVDGNQYQISVSIQGLSYYKDRFESVPFKDGEVRFDREVGVLFQLKNNGKWYRMLTDFNADRTEAFFRTGDKFQTLDLITNTIKETHIPDLKKYPGWMQHLETKGNFVVFNNKTLRAFNNSGKSLWNYETKDSLDPSNVAIDPEGKFIAVFENSTGQIHMINTSDGKLFKSFGKKGKTSNPLAFRPGHQQLAYFNFDDNVLILLNYKTGKSTPVKFDFNYPRRVSFSLDGKLLAVENWSYDVAVFKLKNDNRQKLYDIHYLKDNGTMVIHEDGYYMSNPDAHRDMAFQYDNKIYPCEQFDVWLNRPDKILSHSPYHNEELVSMYEKAIQKRKDKLGVKGDLNVSTTRPEIQIINKHEYSNVVFEDQAKLDLSFTSENNIASYNIWLNDVPLYGQDGKQFKTENTTIEENVHLIPGKNKIQVSALDDQGNQSLLETMNITREDQDLPKLYLITVGVSEYKDSSFNLNYASKDARDMYQLLKESSAFKKVNHLQLLDGDVTKEQLERMHEFLKGAGQDDVVLMFVAGHGVLDENFNYYFATHNLDFDNPAKHGIAYHELEAVLDKIPSIRKILLMDTCHSGEVEADELEVTEEVLASNEDIVFRTAGANVQRKHTAGSKNTSELMKEMFADMRKFTGTTVISSAGGGEFAIESKEWHNGLFTYSLLDGIKSMKADLNMDGEIWLSEIQDYIYTNVTKLSKGQQSPNTRWQNLSMDYRIW